MAVTVKSIYQYLDEIAPFSTQESYDNAGFLVGDIHAPVQHIGVVLDITVPAVMQAKKAGIELIISHHPVIFHPQKQVLADSPIYAAAQQGIHAICAHTNLDRAQGGVNDVLAQQLGLMNVIPLSLPHDCELPILRGGELPQHTQMDAHSYARQVAAQLGAPVRYCAGEAPIRRVAVCGGGGADEHMHLSALGYDAYVTGDASHHHFLQALQSDLTLIIAGHYETENPIVPVLAGQLRQAFPEVSVTALKQDSPIQHAGMEISQP